jgi:GGDEF domain-containing protein
VSVGIASHDDASPGGAISHAHCAAGDLILAADRALYAAKRAGRAQAKQRDIEQVASA